MGVPGSSLASVYNCRPTRKAFMPGMRPGVPRMRVGVLGVRWVCQGRRAVATGRATTCGTGQWQRAVATGSGNGQWQRMATDSGNRPWQRAVATASRALLGTGGQQGARLNACLSQQATRFNALCWGRCAFKRAVLGTGTTRARV